MLPGFAEETPNQSPKILSWWAFLLTVITIIVDQLMPLFWVPEIGLPKLARTVITYVLLLVVVASAVGLLLNRVRAYKGKGAFRWWWLPASYGMYLACAYVVGLIALLVDATAAHKTQPNQAALNEMFIQYPLPMLVMICVLAPILEELLFREWLPLILKKIVAKGYARKRWLTIVLSIIVWGVPSIIFCLLHIPVGFVGFASYGLMTGFLLAMRIIGKTPLASIGFHVIMNVSVTLMTMIPLLFR